MLAQLLPGNCTPTSISAPANFDLKIHVLNIPYSLLSFKIEQNMTVAIRNREREAGFVYGLTIFNYVTTVSMFLTGIGICRQIWKRGDTADITPYSFLLGLVGGSYWCLYGLLLRHPVILYVNVTQVAIYSAYTAFYWAMSKKKCLISAQLVVCLLLVASLIGLLFHLRCQLVTPFWHTSPLGIVCAAINVAAFAAPLAMLKGVIRQGNTSMLPLPLCAANLLVSSEWLLFGSLIGDINIIAPNAFGLAFASFQLFLFLILPRKAKRQSPLVQCFAFVRHLCTCHHQQFENEEERDSAVFWQYPGEQHPKGMETDEADRIVWNGKRDVQI